VRAVVERGAALVWAPEPLVVTGGADHRMEVTIDAAGGASVWWRDELVLGRAGERPGRCTVLLHADLGGAPWVRHELAIGAPGWDSGAVVGDTHIIGSVLMTAWGPEGLHPQAGGTLSVAVADDRLSLQRLLPTPTFPRRSAHAPSAVNA
jgi:urease accessory protein